MATDARRGVGGARPSVYILDETHGWIDLGFTTDGLDLDPPEQPESERYWLSDWSAASMEFTLTDVNYDLLCLLFGDETVARWCFVEDGGDPYEIEQIEEFFGVTHE